MNRIIEFLSKIDDDLISIRSERIWKFLAKIKDWVDDPNKKGLRHSY